MPGMFDGNGMLLAKPFSLAVRNFARFPLQ